MGKCPYCSKELHLKDFFENATEKIKKGELRVKISGPFRGELNDYGNLRMWVCPWCDAILGFSMWG